jgi:hypothetical protein
MAEINKELASKNCVLRKLFDLVFIVFKIDIRGMVADRYMQDKFADMQEPLRKAFDIGLEAQKKGDGRNKEDTSNITAAADFLAQRVEVDEKTMSFAEVILRNGTPELQEKVIDFIKNCTFTERRTICQGMDIDQLSRNVPMKHVSTLRELKSSAQISNYEGQSHSFNQVQEHRRVISGDPNVITADEVRKISEHSEIHEISLQLESVRNKHGAVAALQILRTEKMLDKLEQIGALNNDLEMSKLISAASGPASEILQNYGTDRSNFVLNMDATVTAIARQRTATKGTNQNSHLDKTRLENMPRDTFVQLMAKAEEWYFGGKQGEFPQELAGIRKGVEAWFEKFAETNFSTTNKKLALDYKQHFRAIANDGSGAPTIIRKIFFQSYCYGVEDAYLSLIEHQSREMRKEFTNLSLGVYQRFQSDGSDGESVANAYRSLERQPLEANTDLHDVQMSRLDTFWCQHPTEEFWTYLFTQRTGETPKQTAERIVGFLSMHPKQGSHSTNLLEFLAYSPCAERTMSSDDECKFIDITRRANSQRFWDGLNAVLGNTEISSDERQELLKQMLAPLNDAQAWWDAGPHTGNDRGAPATLGKTDYEVVRTQMESCGLSFGFDFNENVSVRTRASDLSFYSSNTGETYAIKIQYLTLYTRVQPLIES